jgi:Ca2+-binding RTX toxin-like protein
MNRTLELEVLEDRQLLAASAGIVNGDLVITGTNDRDSISISTTNVITGIQYVNTRFGRMRVPTYEAGVSVTISTWAPGALFGQTQRYLGWAKSSFNLIRVDALGGNDFVRNSSAYSSYLTGGLGDDTLTGGSGVDRLVEWADTDLLLSDAMMSGLGSDTLASIEEAQLTSGDSGNTFNCQYFTGNCTLRGGMGVDVLFGGSGNDHIYGGGNADNLFGMDGDDYLEGQSGADILDGGDGWDTGKDRDTDQMASILAALFTGGDYGIEDWIYT